MDRKYDDKRSQIYIKMKENSTREQQQQRFCIVKHIMGKLNISDMFTKEDKDESDYISIRDAIQTLKSKDIRYQVIYLHNIFILCWQ